MATESIGILIPTAIPGYADSADIQAALRAYHYGSYSYDPANTSPASLVTPSIAKTIYDIEADITALENRPSSGGEVDATQPAPGDFTPPEIPDGFIWVDQDGTVGGQPTSATSVFTNSAPTTSLTSGVIWVDRDSTEIAANPYIPTSIIGAKGDLIVGSANDAITIVSPASTNGFVLNVNSSTTSGLAWIDSAASSQTLTNKSIALGTNTVTGTIAEFNTALTDQDFATVAGSETLTNKTLTSAALTAPVITGTASIWQMMENVAISATAATGTVNYDLLSNGAVTYYTANATGNWTLNLRGNSGTTLNSIMSTGTSLTVAFLVTNGGSAFYQTGFQIDGTASGITFEWQNGTAPIAGNINGIDAYSITVIKTGSATYTVLASQTRFA
jgi:hypothetical protein